MPKLTRGTRFRRSITAAYDLNEAETLLVREIADTIDTIDLLPASKVAELRLQRTLLARLLSQLALPDADTGAPRSPTAASQRGRKAAAIRWRKHGNAQAS